MNACVHDLVDSRGVCLCVRAMCMRGWWSGGCGCARSDITDYIYIYWWRGVRVYRWKTVAVKHTHTHFLDTAGN